MLCMAICGEGCLESTCMLLSKPTFCSKITGLLQVKIMMPYSILFSWKFPVDFLLFFKKILENYALFLCLYFFLSLCGSGSASASPPNSRIFSVVSYPLIVVSCSSCGVWGSKGGNELCHHLSDVTLPTLHFQAFFFLLCLILFPLCILSMSWLNLDCIFPKMVS